jgi:hypothetical protein
LSADRNLASTDKLRTSRIAAMDRVAEQIAARMRTGAGERGT